MKQKKKHRPTDETLSWKELLRLYRKIRIPWGMLILVGGFSLLIKQAQLWLVPYTSKIMTGAITEHGFIAGFVGFTLLYGTEFSVFPCPTSAIRTDRDWCPGSPRIPLVLTLPLRL